MKRACLLAGLVVFSFGCDEAVVRLADASVEVVDASTCVADEACSTNPNAACRTGKVSCASGGAACVDGANRAAGTSCPAGVCDPSGQCVACANGMACTTNPGGACRRGSLACASGSPVCTDADFVDAGASCGVDLVCNGTGSCVGCTANAACTSNAGQPCVSGAIACGTGAPVCVNAAPAGAGTTCGTNLVCDGDGGCAPCVAGAACTTNSGGACVVGTQACGAGASCVNSGNVDAGVSCGAGFVCSGTGVCTGCDAGQACATNPSTPCRAGVTACGSGAPVCADATPTAAGLTCGSDRVCTGDGGCISCQADAGCAPTNNPCIGGSVDCSSGASVCVNTGPVVDGTTCPTGECTTGLCTPGVTAPVGTTNLNTSSLVGRSCADAFVAQVVTLGSTSAVLSAAPAAGCLGAGDEVMLINLRGAPANFGNVGNYELLTLASAVTTTSATFTTSKTRFYGATLGTDTDIGSGATQQKVALIRVPRYGNLLVPAGATLTADPWNGNVGGVLPLRASRITVDGTITVSNLGYAYAPISNSNTGVNATQAGESITGIGTTSVLANLGASGGVNGCVCNISGNTYVPGSAGHADAGQVGFMSFLPPGEPGIAYGRADGTTLTMGSGVGGIFSAGNCPGAYCAGSNGGGGIAALFGGANITINGALTSGATFFGSSGGQLLLRANSVTMAAGAVSCDGSEGFHGGTFRNRGSAGYVSIYFRDAVTGTSFPAAFTQQVARP